MRLNKAIQLLEQYQKWRRDNNVPSKYEQPNPTEVGKAIDVILEDAIKKAKPNMDKIKNVDEFIKSVKN